MSIPVRNIYYLLCYAWNKLEEEKGMVQVDSFDFDRPLDLFARVLNNGCVYLLKRGLDRTYVQQADVVTGIREKINISSSIRKSHFIYGRAVCEFDELSFDVLHNQILKNTLHKLVNTKDLKRELKKELTVTLERFNMVSDRKITTADFSRISLNRNNSLYNFLLNTCFLIHENLMIEKNTGKYLFRNFIENEKRMAYVFQDFVRNFYQREQRIFKVTGKRIEWFAQADESAMNFLPKMNTDIMLCSKEDGRTVIIDTKFYKDVLIQRYNKEVVISNNLYQIYSYVKNWQDHHPGTPPCEGMLLYPVVKKEVDLDYTISGHKISIKTIDLSQECDKIKDDLLDLVK